MSGSTAVPWWHRHPPGEWFAEYLRDLPPGRVDLIDGVVYVTPQNEWHSTLNRLLLNALSALCPEDLHVTHEKSLAIGPKTRPEPDLIVTRVEPFIADPDRSVVMPSDVLLAVETVSPESEDRDRATKKALYAQVGIPHMWLVERGEDRRPFVRVLTLSEGAYREAGVFTDQLTVPLPFPITVDLAAITPRF